MRRMSVFLAALLGLLLAACAPTNASVPVPTGTTAPDIAKIVKAQPDDWKRGPDGAKVTIIEWGDFQ